MGWLAVVALAFSAGSVAPQSISNYHSHVANRTLRTHERKFVGKGRWWCTSAVGVSLCHGVTADSLETRKIQW